MPCKIIHMKRRRRKYTFYEAAHSAGGKLATYLAVASLLIFLVCIAIAAVSNGNAGVYTGGLGLISILISAYGLVISVKSFREKETLPLFSILGSLGCGVMLLVWVMTALSGAG